MEVECQRKEAEDQEPLGWAGGLAGAPGREELGGVCWREVRNSALDGLHLRCPLDIQVGGCQVGRNLGRSLDIGEKFRLGM